jgi:hypothetical protein
MAWTVEDLIASVKRRAMIPTAQGTFQTADFLAIANEEMQGYIVPLLLSQRPDLWIVHYDVTLSNNVLEYRLPTRAIGQSLRSVHIINTLNQLESFPKIARENLDGASRGFYIDGNVLVLAVSNPNDVGNIGSGLRMTYHQRPNTLVSSTAVGVVSTVDTVLKKVTLTGTAPAGFGGANVFDILRGRPGYEWLAMDRAGTVSGTSITFADALPGELVAGDVIALAGEGNYPQVPPEIHGLLAQRVAVKCLEAMGDTEGIQAAAGIMAGMEKDAVRMVSPRVAGNTERIVNRSSPFRLSW